MKVNFLMLEEDINFCILLTVSVKDIPSFLMKIKATYVQMCAHIQPKGMDVCIVSKVNGTFSVARVWLLC